MMKRRQSILLLELLISFVMMGIVLEMLFLGYRQSLLSKRKIYEEKEIVLGRERLLLRLGTVFQTLQSCQPVADGWFLRYDGGMDPEPCFRGPIDGLLGIKEGRLLLISWPEEGAPRIETLYKDKNLKAFSFQFFDIKKGRFGTTYPETPPSMMKMTIDSTFPFELPFFL